MAKKVAIIGAGPGGYAAAIRAARLGAEVTVIERDAVGGTCLNWGCIPSKVFKTTAELMDKFREAETFGIQQDTPPRLDMARLLKRKHEVIQTQARGMLSVLKQQKITFLEGRAEIPEPHLITVPHKDGNTTTVPWDRLILATGSRPLEIPAFPFDGEHVISSSHVLELNEIPGSLIIVGGGVVGCEFAAIFSALGSRVTIVEALSRLLPLPSVDEESSKILQREFKKRKIRFLLNRTVESVEIREHAVRAVTGPSPLSPGPKKAGKEPETIDADKMLVCIGRSPNTDGLGLDALGVETDNNGWIRADRRLKTSAPYVWAIGDALGPARVMLAHVASSEGMIAAENAMGSDEKMDYTAVPGAIFTLPEVADVGLTETQAGALGHPARSDTVLFRTIGKAHVIGEIAGQAKIVSHAETGRVLGMHIIGPRATELIAEGTLAVHRGCTVRELARTIHAHPTLAEILMEASLKATE